MQEPSPQDTFHLYCRFPPSPLLSITKSFLLSFLTSSCCYSFFLSPSGSTSSSPYYQNLCFLFFYSFFSSIQHASTHTSILIIPFFSSISACFYPHPVLNLTGLVFVFLLPFELILPAFLHPFISSPVREPPVCCCLPHEMLKFSEIALSVGVSISL